MKHLLNALFAATLTASMLPGHAFAGDDSAAKSTTDSKNSKSVIQDNTPVSTDIFTLDILYTGQSNIRQAGVIGKQDSMLTDFSYNHRFHIEGNWYFRAGIDYERFDFFKNVAPLPNRLQALSALVAFEYVVHDFAAVSVEARPGFAYENDISGKNFSVPIDAYFTFPIVKDKLFGMVGGFYGENFNPSVEPLGGIIWLINDKLRLQAIFPRPSLIYSVNENLDLSIDGRADGYGFRTDTNGRTPATYQNARVEYLYETIGAAATWHGWKPFDVKIGGGYSIDREFDFIHYGPGQKYHAAGAPYIQFSIEAKF